MSSKVNVSKLDSLVFLLVQVHVRVKDVMVDEGEELVLQAVAHYLYCLSWPVWEREREAGWGKEERSEGEGE